MTMGSEMNGISDFGGCLVCGSAHQGLEHRPATSRRAFLAAAV